MDSWTWHHSIRKVSPPSLFSWCQELQVDPTATSCHHPRERRLQDALPNRRHPFASPGLAAQLERQRAAWGRAERPKWSPGRFEVSPPGAWQRAERAVCLRRHCGQCLAGSVSQHVSISGLGSNADPAQKTDARGEINKKKKQNEAGISKAAARSTAGQIRAECLRCDGSGDHSRQMTRSPLRLGTTLSTRRALGCHRTCGVWQESCCLGRQRRGNAKARQQPRAVRRFPRCPWLDRLPGDVSLRWR